MLYPILKLYARFAIRIYCRRIVINKPHYLKSSGPMLLAANHPNSFLDGIILTTLFEREIKSLARGDAFQHPFINKFLRKLRLLPVYRTSEGVHNLGQNYTTFDACHKTFEQKGIVLIFSEGRCENEWHLRPLKKGTARLATTAWQNGVPLRVLPVGFNYSSFKWFGKTVHLNFGDVMSYKQYDPYQPEGKQLLDFNEVLHHQLQQLVYEIDEYNKTALSNTFKQKRPFTFYALLALPAIAGWLLHALLYYPIKILTDIRFERSGHYDSVLHSAIILLYPLYLLLVFFIALPWGWMVALITTALMPAMAWAWVQLSEVWE